MNKPLDNKGRTPKHEPRLMDRLQMQDILEPNMAKIQQQVFFNNELGIVHGDPTLFRLIMKQRPPFIINDHRMGIVVRGEADINFNLQDRHLWPIWGRAPSSPHNISPTTLRYTA